MFERVLKDCGGNIVVPGAVMLVALTALGGGAVDMMLVQNQRSDLQALADEAALAAAREFAITADDAMRIEAVASAYVDAKAPHPDAVATPVADLTAYSVTVDITAPVETFFAGPMSKLKEISVTSTAELAGQPGNVCMIGLSGDLKRTIVLNNMARLTARSCAIYSNSTDQQSMFVNPTADIAADMIYLAGGFLGRPSGTLKEPVTDAPPIADPLASRTAPTIGGCDYTDHVVTGLESLSGGVYCGGLVVDGGTAELFAGEYIIKDGPLHVTNGGVLDGDYVGFYLSGDDAKLRFDGDSSIDLSAPKDGDLTGLLFFADPTNATVSSGAILDDGHVIRSDDARRLVGTIYLPDDKLIIDGDEPVADLSEYTVIVAKAFELNNGPNLVLQTDYAASDIPVPDGVGPRVEKAEAKLVR